jgi:GTP pyrophosphokinase
MVYVPYSLDSSLPGEVSYEKLGAGLPPDDVAKIRRAVELIEPIYYGRCVETGEEIFRHAVGTALIAAALKLDVDSRIAALLFLMYEACPGKAKERIEKEFGSGVARLANGLERLNGLRLIVQSLSPNLQVIRIQPEVMRKMILAMSDDIRVILLRLASRTQTLRYYAEHPGPERAEIARASLDILAPLANRLGMWEIKWEIEDRCFNFLNPDAYRQIARMLDERRSARERFVAEAVYLLKEKCAAVGIQAEIYGRPKHIYSIWKKMYAKQIPLEEVYDLHALRVIVDHVHQCYTVLDIVHQYWTPIAKEYDDYIARPKENNYQSLHTAVLADGRRPMEVQIRTWDMHECAEQGAASHWRYKEGLRGTAEHDAYGNKVDLLRELLAWRKDVADTSNWNEEFKRAALDDTIYVLTPQGRVVDLPHGATPIDFAYHVHTQVGHRCRGAKANGVLIALNKPLTSGQVVEITTAKQGGPSRDWLNPQLGYLRTSRARNKIRQYFTALDENRTMAEGRALVLKELQREGATRFSIDDLAAKLGLANADALFLAAGRNELGYGAVRQAISNSPPPRMDRLMTQLARCCKPAPGDEIQGYITNGKGISIHRVQCRNFVGMTRQSPERVIHADWGGAPNNAVYAVDIVAECSDRTGLLRDIMEVMAHETINVTAANTLSRQGSVVLNFTLEVLGTKQLQRALKLISGVPSVRNVHRA